MTAPRLHLRLRRCDCGATPRYLAERCAEDAMVSTVFCPSCGARSEEIEDAYGDPEGAAYLWNRRALEPRIPDE